MVCLEVEDSVEVLVDLLSGRLDGRERGRMRCDVRRQRCLLAHLEIHVNDFVGKG